MADNTPPEILLVPAGTHNVRCDGGKGGHPAVWYTLDGGEATCGYCDRLFTHTARPGAKAYGKT